jgi:hypothetical protein
MDKYITIQWAGHRNDSSPRGSVIGWFVKTGDHIVPALDWTVIGLPLEFRYAYLFWGKIGNKLYIEKKILDREFISMIQSKAKNYKQIDPLKMMARWGKSFNDELSMQIMVMKLGAV